MNSTWLSRKIKGPNAEGDPVKKKKGVKPYQAIDMADYNKRQQMYSDSLSANIATQNIAKTIKSQSGGDWTDDLYLKKFDTLGDTPYKTSGTTSSFELDANRALGALFGFSDDKPKSKPTSNNTNLYKNYSSVKGIGSSINELKRTDKSLGVSGKQSNYLKKDYYFSTQNPVTEYFDDSIIMFNLPYRPKPKQEILPPPTTKKKSTTTKSVAKKKRPKDTISKMPIGKLKSKSTTPKKLESRQNMKMYKQSVIGTSGKREPAYQYQKRKGLSDEQMYRSFPGLKSNKTK